jgi:preprotein translocase subunit YajC
VVTGGGFVGVVTRVINDAEVQVEIADGVRVRVVRHTITTVLGKGEPAKAEPTAAGSTKS